MSQWTWASVQFDTAPFYLELNDIANHDITEFVAGDVVCVRLFRGVSAGPYTLTVSDGCTASVWTTDAQFGTAGVLKFRDEDAKELPHHRYSNLTWYWGGQPVSSPTILNGVVTFDGPVTGSFNYRYRPYFDFIVVKNTSGITEGREVVLTAATDDGKASAELSITFKSKCEDNPKYCADQAACEAAGHYWFDGACHIEPARDSIANEDDCAASGGYWYDGSCHDEPFDECADDAGLCYEQADCEAKGWFWYDNACHSTPDTTPINYDLQVSDIYTGSPVAGASVYLNGTLKGTTDSNGVITLSNVVPGATYPLKITATGYQDSDLDTIANDSITIPT